MEGEEGKPKTLEELLDEAEKDLAATADEQKQIQALKEGAAGAKEMRETEQRRKMKKGGHKPHQEPRTSTPEGEPRKGEKCKDEPDDPNRTVVRDDEMSGDSDEEVAKHLEEKEHELQRAPATGMEDVIAQAYKKMVMREEMAKKERQDHVKLREGDADLAGKTSTTLDDITRYLLGIKGVGMDFIAESIWAEIDPEAPKPYTISAEHIKKIDTRDDMLTDEDHREQLKWFQDRWANLYDPPENLALRHYVCTVPDSLPNDKKAVAIAEAAANLGTARLLKRCRSETATKTDLEELEYHCKTDGPQAGMLERRLLLLEHLVSAQAKVLVTLSDTLNVQSIKTERLMSHFKADVETASGKIESSIANLKAIVEKHHKLKDAEMGSAMRGASTPYNEAVASKAYLAQIKRNQEGEKKEEGTVPGFRERFGL